MRRKILSFLLIAIILFSQTTIADARGFSRGFSSKSFSKSFGSSKGWGGSSSKKSWGGFSSKSSSKSTKSSSGFGGSSTSRTKPGSYSGSSSSTQSNSFGKSKTTTKKASYMQDAYKSQASKSNFSSYKQKLNTEQQKSYDSAMNSKFTSNKRMNFEDSMRTRSSRINFFNTRPIFIGANPMYFGGPLSYGSAHIGMWDMWFLMRASDLFWYHHWHEITPYRNHFQEAEYAKMEARVTELEKQNNGQRDSTYMDPDVDPDLQLSNEYQQKNPDSVYYTDKYSSPPGSVGTVIFIILAVLVILILTLRKAAKSSKRAFKSRIY